MRRESSTSAVGGSMREQQGQGPSGEMAGRRGRVIRPLLGINRRLTEGDDTEGVVGVSSGSGNQTAAAGGGEERKAVVRVVAADMPPALQPRVQLRQQRARRDAALARAQALALTLKKEDKNT